MKKTGIFGLLFISAYLGFGQLFQDESKLALVRQGIRYIYNVQPDSADYYIAAVDAELPDHPAVPMMKALNILWTNIPLATQDRHFKEFTDNLQETIRLAEQLDGGREEDPEAIFFEMTARGLLAEYYADDGHYMKALGEANKAYGLIKRGFDLVGEQPEFLLTTGVYNYFRVKYPERHPVYKPLVWFFRNGDIELGLQQLEQATREAVLTRVEAYVYLAYIYLRYEYKPEKAQGYFAELDRTYPNNPYFQVKYYEALASTGHIEKASLDRIRQLSQTKRPYYRMAGEAFWGMYIEQVQQDDEEAIVHYRQSISAGSDIPGSGKHYRSLAYLGLGRIYTRIGNEAEAAYNLDKAISFAETEHVEREAKHLMGQL